MERYYQIGKANLKLNLLPHVLLSILLLALSPVFMGTANLDAAGTARVLEMYVALIGIILLTPVFLPEQNKDIKELVTAKYTSYSAVIIIRIVTALFCLALLTWLYIYFLIYNNCTFNAAYFYPGTLAEAVFLGGLGLFAYAVFDQIAVAYMLPLMYYILSVSGGKKLLKGFYPFSMIYGGYSEKINLAVIGAVLITAGIIYPYAVKRLFHVLYRGRIKEGITASR